MPRGDRALQPEGHPVVIIEALVVGLLQTNCYVIGDEEAREGAIIDPGGDVERILNTVDRLGASLHANLRVKYVINTHAHFDHILGNSRVIQSLSGLQKASPELVVHSQAAPLLAADGGARWFGFASTPSPRPDRLVSDGDVLPLGELSLQILHTPGHSPGSISLYCATAKALFAGDVLFQQGVGRSDLPGGDWATLINSIRNRLFALPDDTKVYPGHGPLTTIGLEKRNNPFVGSV